jgi:phosphoesterase family protein
MVEQIEHVVVLMLENRSFDHMLGCFQQIYPGLNGIDPGAPPRSNPNIANIPVLQAPDAERVLANDPKHETRDVLVWQLRDANLAGDASFVIRPHTASSTSKGIANAFALSRELAKRQTLSESLENWQLSELDRGRSLMNYGQGLGGRSQGR